MIIFQYKLLSGGLSRANEMVHTNSKENMHVQVFVFFKLTYKLIFVYLGLKDLLMG